MTSKLSKLRFEDIRDGHSEGLVDRSRWHLQTCNKFHEGLFVHNIFSLELSHIFGGDIDGIDSTDRYEFNSIFTKSNPLQIIFQLILDGSEPLRIPVYSVHFVHRHNELMHSKRFYDVGVFFGLPASDE